MATARKSSEEQERIVSSLRVTLNKYTSQEIPDNVLIQFLEANVWNIDDAKQQLTDTIEWRKKMDIDHLPVATKYNKLPVLIACRGYKHIEDANFQVKPELSESIIRIANTIGGDCFHKFDKDGHPVLIDRTGHHNTKEMGNNVTTEEITNYQISVNEFLNRVIMPEGSERAGKLLHSETVIFDCTNMSLWQFHMNGMYHLKAIADIVQHYYPEALHRFFVVNAPSAFVVMFKVIKPWLNPRTLDKIHVLGKGFESVLLQYIDEENLPSFLGGKCTCSHMPGGCVPTRNPNEKHVPTDDNDKVPTVYGTSILEGALSGSIYTGLSQNSNKNGTVSNISTSTATTTTATIAASSSTSLSKVA